jgi:hypothetical protein
MENLLRYARPVRDGFAQRSRRGLSFAMAVPANQDVQADNLQEKIASARHVTQARIASAGKNAGHCENARSRTNARKNESTSDSAIVRS